MLNNITNVIAIPDYENDVIHLFDCENVHTEEIENIIYDYVCYEYTKENDKGCELFERWYYEGVELLWYKKDGKQLFENILINLYRALSVADLYDVLVHVEQPKRSKNTTINGICKTYQFTSKEFFEKFKECIKLQSNTKEVDKKEFALKLRVTDKKVAELFESTAKCTMNEPLNKWLHLAECLQQQHNLTNKGQAFEYIQTTLYGVEPYKLDNIGFWTDGDYTTKEGKKVQCKTPKATLVTIETLKKLIEKLK